MIRKFFWSFLVFSFMISFNVAYAEMSKNVLTISNFYEQTGVSDENGYLTIVREPQSSYTWNGELTIHQDYEYIFNENNERVYSPSLGDSRVTLKVDKAFISDDDNDYDISIEYYDVGVGVVLLQSSTDSENRIDYAKTSYGGYPEESWWTWNDEYFYANLNFNLTNTYEWKTFSFHVTDDFFTDNVDNYIHFYYGRDVNWDNYLRIKSITITKRVFKISSISKNEVDHVPVIGNIYTAEDFGMGFQILNTSDAAKNLMLEYSVLDEAEKEVEKTEIGVLKLESKESKEFYIDTPVKNGTYELIVRAQMEDQIEEENLSFSKIMADLTSKENEFIGLNSIFGIAGWATEKNINDAVIAGNKLGFYQIRTAMSSGYIVADKATGYQNQLGRYEDLYDTIIDEKGQKVLFVIHARHNIPYEEIVAEIAELYASTTERYKDKVFYYEILNEINLSNEFSIEEYAEIMVKTAIAIHEVDKNAKIVGIDSNRIPIYENGDYSQYSINSWMAKVLDTAVGIDDDDDGTFDRKVKPIEILDVISVHPYTETIKIAPESDGIEISIFSQLTELRKLIEALKEKNNVSKSIPIWVTEFGYPTNYLNSVSKKEQAAFLTRELTWYLANKEKDSAYVEKVFIYGFQNTGFTNMNSEGNYGIVEAFKKSNLKGYPRDVEMAAKPSYVAIDAFSNILNGAIVKNSNALTCESDDFYWYQFQNEVTGNAVIVAWTNHEMGENKMISLPVKKGKITIYDMYGNILTEKNNKEESLQVEVRADPVYLVMESGNILMLGDLDSDFEITILDVRLLLQAYINAGLEPKWTESDLAVMDMNHDMVIDILDVRLLLQSYINQ